MTTEILELIATARSVVPWGDVREMLETAEKARPMTWPVVSRSLSRISGLNDDWDGQGAGAPNDDVVQLAKVFARALRTDAWPAPSYIRATPDGCISFEWTSDSESILEAEVSQSGIEYIVSGPGVPTRSYFKPVV